MTFAQYNAKTNQFANALLNLGIQPGARVAVLLKNCNACLIAYFGAIKTGACTVPLNFRLSGPELAYILNDSQTQVLVFGAEFVPLVNNNRDNFSSVESFICVGNLAKGTLEFNELLGCASSNEPSLTKTITENDLAILMYTAGTTGFPKGVMLSHRNLLSNAISTIVTLVSPHFEDIYLMVLPLFHAAALGVAVRLFIAGSMQILHDAFDPVRTLEAIQKERISWVSFVPTMITKLLDVPNLAHYNLSSLRIISYGTSPISPTLLRRMLDAFHCEFNQGFGQTEHSPVISFLTSADHVMDAPGKEILLKSVGRPIFNVQVRIVDLNEVDVARGQVGEIIAQSDSVMKGYWNKPDLTAEALRNGWLHTGDLGKVDERGYIFIVDRKKDMIKSGGENIFPKEIENVLYSLPEVAECAVIGIPDDKWGEIVKAFIALREGTSLSPETVLEKCKQQLADFKKPRQIVFLKELPKNAAGKILKFKLKEIEITHK